MEEKSGCIVHVQDTTFKSHSVGTPVFSLILVLLSLESSALTALAWFLLHSYIYAFGYNRSPKNVHAQPCKCACRIIVGNKKKLIIILFEVLISLVLQSHTVKTRRSFFNIYMQIFPFTVYGNQWLAGSETQTDLPSREESSVVRILWGSQKYDLQHLQKAAALRIWLGYECL